MHRGESEQDAIRWKNLLREAADKLTATKFHPVEMRGLLSPAQTFGTDRLLWRDQGGGLAYFLAPGFQGCYRLPLALAERVVVGPRFFLKPLFPLLRDNGRFYVLALSRNSVRFFQGSHYGLRELRLRDVPTTMETALQFHDRDEPLRVHSCPAPGGKGAWAPIYSGQGVGIDDAKDDVLRYFQQIDHGVCKKLPGERAPLVLAGVEYLWPIYRRANHYTRLLEEGISGNADHLSAEELHTRAWAIVAPHFDAAEKKAAALYRQVAGTGRTSADVAEIVRCARQGWLEYLFVSLNQECWGAVDPATNKVALHEHAGPGDEDLLNLAAIAAFTLDATVYALEPAKMPSPTAAAAIFWLPLAKRRK
jgi:hypothetical protein